MSFQVLRENSPAYGENRMPKSTEEMLISLVRNQGFLSKEALIFCSMDQSENFHCEIQCCEVCLKKAFNDI